MTVVLDSVSRATPQYIADYFKFSKGMEMYFVKRKNLYRKAEEIWEIWRNKSTLM